MQEAFESSLMFREFWNSKVKVIMHDTFPSIESKEALRWISMKNINIQNFHLHVPLHELFSSKEWATLRFTLPRTTKFVVNSSVECNTTPSDVSSSNDASDDSIGGEVPFLHYVAASGEISLLRILVRQGYDVDARGGRNFTSLMWAANNNHLDIVKFLLQNGADVNAQDDTWWTALHKACRNNNMDIVKYLVNNGADKNAKSYPSGRTPLDIAMAHDHHDIVKFLASK